MPKEVVPSVRMVAAGEVREGAPTAPAKVAAIVPVGTDNTNAPELLKIDTSFVVPYPERTPPQLAFASSRTPVAVSAENELLASLANLLAVTAPAKVAFADPSSVSAGTVFVEKIRFESDPVAVLRIVLQLFDEPATLL